MENLRATFVSDHRSSFHDPPLLHCFTPHLHFAGIPSSFCASLRIDGRETRDCFVPFPLAKIGIEELPVTTNRRPKPPSQISLLPFGNLCVIFGTRSAGS